MSFSGSLIQNAIYIAQQPPEWPVTAEDWERAAEERLEPGPFGYIAGGAGSESTMRANLDAFGHWRLRPRMLTGNAVRDISVEVLGMRSPAPFFLAPIGVLSIAHEDGRGRGRAGRRVVRRADGALERRDPLARGGRRDRRAALVPALLGERPRDLRELRPACRSRRLWRDRGHARHADARLAPAGPATRIPAVPARPRLRTVLQRPGVPLAARQEPDEDLLTAAATMLATFPNLGLEWSDLDWLRGQTALPILVKGVLTADDARAALEHGVDGIIVSNHGGRQVDGAVAALDALVEVRDALPDAVVLMDGGIRCAADVLKAMALGADAVLLGRPYAYALAVGGARGVEELIQNLMAEIDLSSRSPAGTRSATSTVRG